MHTLKVGTFYPTLFTNVALNPQTNEPWWEGLNDPPSPLLDWRDHLWQPNSGTPAAHPNSRFTVCLKQCPTLSPEFENPQGVPISAIFFGSRRERAAPLILESFHWVQGVLWAAIMGTETTAAATGKVGLVRFSLVLFLA